MKVIIAGGRDFEDLTLAESAFFQYVLDRGLPLDQFTIISGKARGADTCGRLIAEKHNLQLIEKAADWDRWGKAAGYRRNVEMAEQADGLIAFWDGKSKGTKHMLDIAEQKGLITELIGYGRDILTFTTPEHRWLSNMALVKIDHKGIIYPSTENFYQAMKYGEHDIWYGDNYKITTVREYISKLTPYRAKNFSKVNQMTNPKFEENKIQIMRWANYWKYQDPKYKALLLNTYNAHLEEGNWWNDLFWGVDIKTREGENHLGKIIMEIRNEIRSKNR